MAIHQAINCLYGYGLYRHGLSYGLESMAIHQAINCLYGYDLYGYDLYSHGLYRHTGSSDDRWMADDSSGRAGRWVMTTVGGAALD